jgi:hypothetical protein
VKINVYPISFASDVSICSLQQLEVLSESCLAHCGIIEHANFESGSLVQELCEHRFIECQCSLIRIAIVPWHRFSWCVLPPRCESCQVRLLWLKISSDVFHWLSSRRYLRPTMYQYLGNIWEHSIISYLPGVGFRMLIRYCQLECGLSLQAIIDDGYVDLDQCYRIHIGRRDSELEEIRLNSNCTQLPSSLNTWILVDARIGENWIN